MTAIASTREGKTALIGDVRAKFEKMTAAVFLDYKGMTVVQATQLRAQFRKVGVEYKVVKNTILKQAICQSAYGDKLDDVLVGMTAIAWCYEDPSLAAKVVKQYKKDAGEAGSKLVVKGGLVDGEVLSALRVENELATMPGKDELRSMLLATFQAPLQQFVALLQAPTQNLVYVLAAKERQLGNDGPEASQ